MMVHCTWILALLFLGLTTRTCDTCESVSKQFTDNYCRIGFSNNQTSRDGVALCTEIEPQSWHLRYFDEASATFELLVCEDTVDMRVANQIDSINKVKLVNTDVYSINSGHADVDRELEKKTAGSQVSEEMCTQHLRQLTAQLEQMEQINDDRRQNQRQSTVRLEEQHLRLARVLDSFGRYESGIHSGRAYFLGDYQQCVGTQLLLDDQLVTTRYCVAKLNLNKHLELSLKAYQRRPQESIAQLQTAVCLPESCHTTNRSDERLQLIKILINSQLKLPPSVFVDETPELDSIYCQPDHDSEFFRIPFSGKLLLALLFAWTGLVIYTTHKNSCDRGDAGYPSSSSHDLSQILSLERSYADFLAPSEQEPKSRVCLDVLNPIKVIAMLVVVFCHSFLVQIITADDLLRAFKSLEDNPLTYALAAGTHLVDSFFVMTGLLLSFISLKKIQNQSMGCKNTTLFGLAFVKRSLAVGGSRYLRLVPMYFLVFWFKKSLFVHLNSGPIWDVGLNRFTAIGGCMHNDWLTPFTFMAGYLPFAKQCISSSWSIACDLCFSIVAGPIIVMLANHQTKFATVISVVICAISTSLAHMQFVYLPEEVQADFQEVRVRAIRIMFQDLSTFYTAPHCRASSFFIGVLAGYILHRYYTGHLTEWPHWLRGIATKLSFAFILGTFLVPALIPLLRSNLLRVYPLHGAAFVTSHSFGRSIWALSNVVMFLRMMTDWKDGWWMQNAATSFWRCIAKLNYIILLVHLDLFIFDALSRMTSSSFSIYKSFTNFAFVYLLSLLIALVVHVVFENPINKLVKVWTHNKQHEVRRKPLNGLHHAPNATSLNSGKAKQA